LRFNPYVTARPLKPVHKTHPKNWKTNAQQTSALLQFFLHPSMNFLFINCNFNFLFFSKPSFKNWIQQYKKICFIDLHL
jgi:hypothetical protein